MSHNNDDLELEGFDFGTGDDNPSSDGFVSDDEFGFGDFESENLIQESEVHHNVPPKVTQPQESAPVQTQNVAHEQHSQSRPNSQQRVQRQGQGNPQQARPNQSQRVQRQGQQQPVQVVGGSDRMRMKSQQRINPDRPKPQTVQQAQSNTQLQQRQQQMPKQRRQPQMQQMVDEGVPMIESTTPPTKKKSKLPFILVPLVIIAVIIGVVYMNSNKLVPQEENYAQTGRYAYDTLLSALNSYDATQVDSVVGTSTGDSYLAQEWSYANNIEIRQNFIKSICANVSFTYPQTNQLSTTGETMTGNDGSPILVTSSMNNGELVSVTHVDYKALAEAMKEDKEVILDLFDSSGITAEDYDYEDEMTDLMLDYIVSKGNLPTTTTDISLGVSLGGTPMITDDSALDKLLFSSDDFHNMCDVFAQVATGFTGYETEKYTEKEEQPNPEYTQWKMRFDAYFEADNGRFIKGVSKWEPWYLRDENNNYILDENGEKIVNYYSVKDDQGNDWIQPAETVIVDVEKERQVEVEWVKDSVVPYCFMGAYYCQNEYNGSFSPEVRVGDGTIQYPAGVGTPIITKCLGTDGKYHDVKVTMTGYWVGEDAIDYAISFSEKNRGFDINSVIQLICYEIKIENLENKAFTFNSDMFLSDKNSNKSTRTGTMYGFYSSATVEAGESVIINDWATSTELNQKYVCWGSSFNRTYNTVYFKVLAGEGDVPTYSAYKAFTGESEVNEETNGGTSSTVTPDTTDTSGTTN